MITPNAAAISHYVICGEGFDLEISLQQMQDGKQDFCMPDMPQLPVARQQQGRPWRVWARRVVSCNSPVRAVRLHDHGRRWCSPTRP